MSPSPEIPGTAGGGKQPPASSTGVCSAHPSPALPQPSALGGQVQQLQELSQHLRTGRGSMTRPSLGSRTVPSPQSGPPSKHHWLEETDWGTKEPSLPQRCCTWSQAEAFKAVLALTRGVCEVAKVCGRAGASLGEGSLFTAKLPQAQGTKNRSATGQRGGRSIPTRRGGLLPGKATWTVRLLGVQAQLTEPVRLGAGAGHPSAWLPLLSATASSAGAAGWRPGPGHPSWPP